MTESKTKKLYPLFVQPSKSSDAVGIDISAGDGSDGDEDEDDLPLTCLLTQSKRKDPPREKSSSKQILKKKQRKSNASKATINTRFKNKKNGSSADCRKEKPRNIAVELAGASNSKTKFTAKATHQVVKNASETPSSITRCKSFHKSIYNGNDSDGTETIDHSCEDKIVAPVTPKTSRPITIENNYSVSRLCRLYSDAGMDFGPNQSPDESHVHKICNIIYKLNRRIANGACLSQHPYCRHYPPIRKARVTQNQKFSVPSLHYWPQKWRIPSWLSLEQPEMGNIDHMAWDPMGVLLAIVVDRAIIIYDWDMLRAADLKGRSDRARNCRESQFKIPPVVRFRVQYPVESLVWNPHQIDELAVGFRVTGETIIYNVNEVARWLSNNPLRNNQRPPPQTTYKRVVLQRVTGSVIGIVFLNIQDIVLSVGKILYCWKLPLSNEVMVRQVDSKEHQKSLVVGTLVWRYQPPSPVTSMARLGSNLIVVGTDHGHMCLIDWTKRSKVTLSFSHEHRPKVLQTWIPHDSLSAPNEDKALKNKMGIMKMRVETSNQECVLGKRHWGRCRVKWVTRSGWLLSTIIESARIQNNCIIHYSSPQVVFKNADGSLINRERKSWSLPYSRIGVDLPNQGPSCFVGIPSVTKVLSHHDKFVLDSQPSTIVSKEMLMVVGGIDNEIQKIPFPGVVKDLPQTLTVHPSLEWIVIGERKRLHIMVPSRRGNMKMQCTSNLDGAALKVLPVPKNNTNKRKTGVV